MSDTKLQDPPVMTLHDVLKHAPGEHPEWCDVCHKQSKNE